ncbi:MAG: MaoC family dehydratase N-terminal domain-containing protein [Gammaproteobacteria bacterium]|jgi:hypothetical protein
MNERFYIDALRDRFLMQDFDEQTFVFTAAELADYAISCGELAPRYTDPTHPDFQASPTLATCLRPGRRLPEGFPPLPGLGMDAGKAVAPKAPIRADVPLTARTHIHDIYVKTGRSGRMTFIVTRMEVYDPAGAQLATADTRIVIREKPEA